MAARRRFRWSFRDAREIGRAAAFDAAPRRDQGPKLTPQVFATDPDANANAPGEQSPASGGAEEQAFDQNRRRVRLTGRDQEGSNYGAELYLPAGGPDDRRTGDAALRDLLTPRDGRADISGLAELQRRLNQYYRS